MIIKRRKFLFFTSTRIILDDDALNRAFTEKNDSYITGISYNKFDFGSDVKVNPKQTIVIDLNRDLDDIMKSFNETARRYIRKSYEIDQLSIVARDDNLKDAYKVYKNFTLAQKRTPHSFSYFSNGSIFFNAYLNGEIISSVGCYDSKPYLRAWAICSKRLEAQDKGLYKIIGYASRRLFYEICKYGKENGYTTVDLGGYNVKAAKTGIAQFKSSFGGLVASDYTYSYKTPLLRIAMRFFKRRK